MRHVYINCIDMPFTPPIQARWCSDFLCKLLGLMFKKEIKESEGLLFVNERESILNSSIHMFFMNFDIFIVWLNSSFQVVDIRNAHKWQPFLFPQKPAQYVLELNPKMSDKIRIGNTLQYHDK